MLKYCVIFIVVCSTILGLILLYAQEQQSKRLVESEQTNSVFTENPKLMIPYDDVVWPNEYLTHAERYTCLAEITKYKGSSYMIKAPVQNEENNYNQNDKVWWHLRDDKWSFGRDKDLEDMTHAELKIPSVDSGGLMFYRSKVQSLVLMIKDETILHHLYAFPELKSLTLHPDNILGNQFHEIRHCNYLTCLSLESYDEMRHMGNSIRLTKDICDQIKKLPLLQYLKIGEMQLTDEDFSNLKGAENIRYIEISNTPNLTPAVFQTIATWPNIEGITIARCPEFSAPLDEQTAEAIASLNGRVKWMSFIYDHDEIHTDSPFQTKQTIIHSSMLPPISKIHSLRRLKMAHVIEYLKRFEYSDEDIDAYKQRYLQLKNIPNYQNIIQYGYNFLLQND
jgi:hypothetical protein